MQYLLLISTILSMLFFGVHSLAEGTSPGDEGKYSYNMAHDIDRIFDAVENEDVRYVRIYTESGADVDISTEGKNRMSLIGLAYVKNNKEIIKLLEDAKKERDGITQAVTDGHVEYVKKYLELGGDVNFPDRNDYTLLHHAVGSHKTKVVQILLDAGADINYKDHNQQTPIYHVFYDDNPETLKVLLSAKNINLENKSYSEETPLHQAARLKNTIAMTLLVQAGSNINAQDIFGQTALIHAFTPTIMFGSWEPNVIAAKRLMELGVDVNIPDNKGWTPLHYAAKNSYIKSINLLMRHGANPDIKTKGFLGMFGSSAMEMANSEALSAIQKGLEMRQNSASDKETAPKSDCGASFSIA